MSIFSRLFGSNSYQPLSVERDSAGNWFYKMFSSSTKYNNYNDYSNKLKAYQSNAPLHKVIGLIQTVGSMACFNLYENEKLKTKNYLYTVKPRPNPYQTWTEFVKEYLLWQSLGTAYYYKESGTNEINRNSYWLNFDNFDTKTKELFEKYGKKPTLSQKNEILKNHSNHIVKYKYNGKDTTDIKLSLIIPIHSEIGFNNWYEGGSVIDSLQKVISNSESTLDAKNIALHFSQKYMVFSETPLKDHQGAITGFTDDKEDDSQKGKMLSNEKVIVSGAQNVRIERFVERFKEMGYDESFLNDYLVIGIAYGVPLDLLDSWLKGKGLTSQGESQEKSMVRFIEMVIMPMLQRFTDVLEIEQSEQKQSEVKAEFSHMGFMRVVEVEKETQRKTQLENLKIALELGMTPEEMKKQLKLIYNE